MSENINLQNEEEKVAIATFNIVTENTTITLQNLIGMTQIDWGDGTIDSELSHTFVNAGEYKCKIYDVTDIGNEAFKYCSSLTSMVIPDSVTTIGSYAFHSCYSLTSVVIGDSVTTIGDYAFSYCNGLTSITIPDLVTSIGASAFAYCSSLISIEIPDSVTSIGASAFKYCSSLASVVISDSVTTIASSMFYFCERLTSVVIPDSVTSIGSSVFAYCSSLASVVIPDSVTSIGTSAFSSCKSLTSVVIGNSITTIGDRAFYECSGLINITISDNVTDIGVLAFKNCSNLTSVIFKSESPLLSAAKITKSHINDTIPTYYVPANSVEAYHTAWAGVVAAEQIQPDLTGERLITLDGLKTYHKTLKEKYLDSMATQDWVNEKLVGKTDYLGVTDVLPNFPDAGAGDYYRVSAEFVYDETTGEMAHIGDILIAIKDNPTQDKADWDLVHTELNSATMVTVGGKAQVNWEADTKLDKISTAYGNNVHRLYAIGTQGQQYVITTTDSNNVVATQNYADKKIINLHATDILTNQDAAAFITLTKNILDGKCNVFVKLNDAVGALVTEVYYYSETYCQWKVFGQAVPAFYTLTAIIDGENQSITLEEESLGSMFVQFMTVYLNSEETAANKPTAAEISTIFNENEEA